MKSDPCRITVKVPKDTKTRQEVESAIAQALKTQLTNATVASCRERGITISVKFDGGNGS